MHLSFVNKTFKARLRLEGAKYLLLKILLIR